MAAQLQPNFHQLSQHLAGACEQIQRIPNMPAVVGLDALIANLREQHDQALAQQAQQHAATLDQQAQQHAATLAQHAQQHQQLIDRLDALQEGCVLCIASCIASRSLVIFFVQPRAAANATAKCHCISGRTYSISTQRCRRWPVPENKAGPTKAHW